MTKIFMMLVSCGNGLFQLIFVTPPWMSEGSDFPPGKWNLTTHPQETLVCRKYPWKQSENVCLPPRKWGEQEKTLWKTNFSLDYPPPRNIFSSNTPWKFLQALTYPLEMLKYPPSPITYAALTAKAPFLSWLCNVVTCRLQI